MNLMELFVKISVDDQASSKIDTITTGIGNGLAKASKIGVTAITTLGTVAIKTFADFEQLVGGAELMFGDAFGTVMKNAKNAYKTVQMSQNEYLQQVNGFATGLKTALGGNEQAAADLAHRIVQAEADIVAATGNTAENVQNAFNGIMKSNFTMLDNLQIGITPTKEGFQEVIDKVNEWNEANGRATKYQMGNLADMQSALVDYIDMVGMSGYAQNEAAGTILGSFASMKAAASDFMTSLVSDNGDVEGSFETLKESAVTFFDNVKPRVLAFLKAISPIATVVAGITSAFIAFRTAAAISTLLNILIKSWQAYKLANDAATVSQWALNAAMNANPIVLVVTLIAGLVAALVTLWKTNDSFRNAVINAWNAIKTKAENIFGSIARIFTKKIPDALRKAVSTVVSIGANLVEGLWQGVSNKVGWITRKMASFGKRVIKSLKNFFGIHSPSTVMRDEIGRFLAEGVAVGFMENDPMAEIETSLNNGIRRIDTPSLGVYGGGGYSGSEVSIIQNIYSQAQTAADLMQEAIYQQEKAVYLGV